MVFANNVRSATVFLSFFQPIFPEVRPRAHYIVIICKHVICVEDIRQKHNKHRKTDTKSEQPLVCLEQPCTSVDSERLFSAASHMLDEKLNRLKCFFVKNSFFFFTCMHF